MIKTDLVGHRPDAISNKAVDLHTSVTFFFRDALVFANIGRLFSDTPHPPLPLTGKKKKKVGLLYVASCPEALDRA